MKKFVIVLITLLVTMFITIPVVDAKSSSFGGRSSSSSSSSSSRSSFSSSRSSGSSSRSSFSSSRSSSFGGRSSGTTTYGSRSITLKTSPPKSGGSYSGSSTSKRALFGGATVGGIAVGSSSDSSTSHQPIKVTRDNVISNLKGKGATGDAAGILYKQFQAKSAAPVINSGKLSRAQIDQVFSPTYRQSRRTEYYGGYKPTPSKYYREYVYTNHSNGYGIWDLLLFDSILDNIGDRQMYYHHQNDPAFQSWRTDANAACLQGDKDVCDKLKDLDREMAQYRSKGVTINPAYITPGIDPDIYETNKIDPKTLPEIKICTGSVGSDYYEYVGIITKVTKLKATPIRTSGSVDNLAKLATGACDLAFVQDDLVLTPNLTKIVTPKQMEAGLLICKNDSHIETAGDLSKDVTIYVGSDQTGSQHTLNQLRDLSSGFASTQVINSQPIMQAIQTVKSSNNPRQCVFAVSTPEFAGFKDLDSVGKFHGVPVFSNHLRKNHPYKLVTVDVDHYKNLTQDKYKSYGTFTKGGIDTIGVPTSLITSQAWIAQNGTLFDLLNLERRNLEVSISK